MKRAFNRREWLAWAGGVVLARRLSAQSQAPSPEAPFPTDPRARLAVAKAGSRIVNIPVDIRPSLNDPDPARVQAAIENGKRWVDVAAALDAPSIRAHIEPAPGAVPDAARAGNALRAIAAYGASKRIVVNLTGPLKPTYTGLLENQMPISESLVERVAANPDRLRALKELLQQPELCAEWA